MAIVAAKREVNGVEVRELTIGEIRTWLAEVGDDDSQDDDIVIGLMGAFTQSDLRRMTNINTSQLEDYTPSQLAEIMEVCKELNAHFFALRAKLVETGNSLLTESSGSPTLSPEVDMAPASGTTLSGSS